MAHDVFISHSSKDKVWADAVCSTLEANGIKCWIAPRDIHEGTAYPAAVASALQTSRAVVLIFSAESNGAVMVQNEIALVVPRKIPIIPFRLEKVPPSGGMEYLINVSQWLDADSKDPEKSVALVVPAVQKLLSSEPATALDKVVIPKLPKLVYTYRRLRRLQIAVAVAVVLGLIGAGTTYYLTRTDKVAVLPFDVTGANGGDELDQLAVGIPGDVLMGLANLGARVSARPTPDTVKDWKGKSAFEAARALHVDRVFRGEMTRHGNILTISSTYQDPFTPETKWSFETQQDVTHPCLNTSGGSQGPLELRKAVATGILNELRVYLSAKDKQKVLKPPTENCEAYVLYLQARDQWNRRDENGFREAVKLYKAATDKDQNFALAFSGIADCFSLMADYSFTYPKDSVSGFEAAYAYAKKAVQMDPSSPEAHTSLAFVLYQFKWEWAEAEKEFKIALNDSKYPTAIQWYAIYLAAAGRREESIKMMEEARNQDPNKPILQVNLGWLYHLARNDDKAFEVLQDARMRFPKFEEAPRQLGDLYVARKDYSEALAQYTEAEKLSGGDIEYESLIARAQALLGRREEALKEIEKLKARPKDKYTPASYIALIYIALGDKDNAFKWLDKAVDDRSDEMILLKVDPAYDPLRSDPRFDALLKPVHFPQ
jgi:tetratricopeptide (TPR) repeat protein